ncbi:preprotein translocase subunit SecG [Myxococcus sp. K15C18031901]|uniref:preprotein translocase subunit SecG n=1 Tax=Myxococcus dinghuensis TaxID=2906761 RepID=UPI0020A71909|nr:preprotein translocase subunit SecG [Myxococcus dinghuensis]MCP3101887.1 preprotein translocase subunit SecG [Myxococcus dinghuensis]
MLIFVTTIHVLVCVFMIFVILLQPGKDAGMGSALGGGAATSAFGGRGAVTFLSKLTGVCAGLFFFTSLGLSFVGLRSSVAAGGSVATPPAAQAPATPGAAAPAEQSTPAAGQQAAPGQVEQPRGEAPAAPAEGQSAPAQQQ